jgi:integrase
MAAKRLVSKLHQLSVREIQHAAEGDHADGGGLLLRIRHGSEAWVYRFTSPAGRRREMGLGAARRGSVAQVGESVTLARGQAHDARELLVRGLDPIDERDKARSAAREALKKQKADKVRERLTLARVARDYHERVIEPSRTDKHGAQWIASLENHVPTAVWHAPIADITAPQLLEALSGVRALDDKTQRIPETLQRVRQRLDSIFEDAQFHGRCTTNPAAAIKRKMTETQPRRERGGHAALPYREAPAFMATLRAHEGIAARCLELAVLTAARTSEVLLATWGEFDTDAALWTVPPERMKGRESHVVHLSGAATRVLDKVRGLHGGWVFPSPILEDRPLSNMAMLVMLDRMGYRDRTAVHGLARATFSTWANETGAARPDIVECCLAHQEGDKIRKAYNRSAYMAERAALLDAWAAFLDRQESNVVPLRAA